MQTTYSDNLEVALEGQLADGTPHSIRGYAAEVEIPFGRAVIAGTDPDHQVKLPGLTTDKILGVSMQSHAREKDAATLKDMINVMRQGAIYVRPEDAVTPASPVFVRFTANGAGKTVGQFLTTDDKVGDDPAVATAVALPGARWETSAAAGGLAVLVINLP